jgi:hypothetical protein
MNDEMGTGDRARPGKATPKPHQCDIRATPKRVDSQPIGTPKPPQGSAKAILKPPQCDPNATPMRPQSHTKATLKPGVGGGKAHRAGSHRLSHALGLG